MSLLELFAEADRAMEVLHDLVEKDGHHIPCESCETPHCCKFMVNVWPQEAELIADTVRSWPKKGRERIERKLVKWLRAWRTAPADVRHSDAKWFLRKRNCPFLDHGHCSIYEVRPSGCRYHYVADQEPERCGNEMNKDSFLNAEPIHMMVATPLNPQYHGPLALLVCSELGLEEVTQSEILTTFSAVTLASLMEMAPTPIPPKEST